MQLAAWARNSERSNITMLRLMTWISLRFGRNSARFILVGISIYFLLFAPVAMAASRHYLLRVLRRKPSLIDLFKHVHSFASTIHDRVFLLNERFDLFQFEIHGTDIFEEVMANGKGALLLGAHMGSFEALRAVGRKQRNFKVVMLMYETNAAKINAVLTAINPNAAQDIIPLGQLDSMLRVRECLDAGMVLGALSDRTISNDQIQPVQFLGKEANFPIGPMRLAAILKRPVLFMCGLYLGDNRYAIHFEKLADFRYVERHARADAITTAVVAYAACLERHCQAAPYNWFNFFDFWGDHATI